MIASPTQSLSDPKGPDIML
ncbi:hypothetical protein PENARI_c006G08292 [Penicillium arizonense]|uniref:Uncharacterized protein n=1 Tax=Penicillium arizonense TaxID=1835702 RepID=A0A1F5LMD5_PENAI|nr:hypothetical protein PENARI_c006G08292 [Penicillium arizonense]